MPVVAARSVMHAAAVAMHFRIIFFALESVSNYLYKYNHDVSQGHVWDTKICSVKSEKYSRSTPVFWWSVHRLTPRRLPMVLHTRVQLYSCTAVRTSRSAASPTSDSR